MVLCKEEFQTLTASFSETRYHSFIMQDNVAENQLGDIKVNQVCIAYKYIENQDFLGINISSGGITMWPKQYYI